MKRPRLLVTPPVAKASMREKIQLAARRSTPMLYKRAFPREEIEDFIRYLADRYPACFFTDQRQKRPLKKNILVDLEKENVLDDDKRTAAVNFYTRDWVYERMLQAGAERIDLDGKKAGVVTEQEQREAEQRVWRQKQERRERDPPIRDPIQVARSLHAAGHISTDQLSKIPAPTRPPMKKDCDPALERLQALLTGANTVLTKTEDPALRSALVTASLRVLITEAEKIIGAN